MKDPKIVLLIFVSGKVVLTGEMSTHPVLQTMRFLGVPSSGFFPWQVPSQVVVAICLAATHVKGAVARTGGVCGRVGWRMLQGVAFLPHQHTGLSPGFWL